MILSILSFPGQTSKQRWGLINSKPPFISAPHISKDTLGRRYKFKKFTLINIIVKKEKGLN